MSSDRSKRVGIVVVGASSGIGAEIARVHSKTKNTYLVLVSRRRDMLEEVATQCKEIGAADVLVVTADATDIQQCQDLMTRAAEWLDSYIDIVYYVAGQAMHALFHEITELKIVADKMMNVNFYGAVWCAHAAIPFLQKRTDAKGDAGSFSVVSSVAGDISPPFLSFYSAAKHAVQGMFESLQNENSGVHFTITLPGYVATEIDDKKVVGDGTVQSVALNVDKSKYMPATKAAELIIGATLKKKKKFHLTTQGSIGSTMLALVPSFINSAAKKEMFRISTPAASSSSSDPVPASAPAPAVSSSSSAAPEPDSHPVPEADSPAEAKETAEDSSETIL